MSIVSESRLHQRKPASNVKLVSVHVSPVYASSVGELAKPLNISKPVCSSNATKRNVCKASSVSPLIKPLNVSKTVCSNNTTRCNVFKVSSVNKLVKPSTVNKPVLSNNVCNVRNVSSISQLVKTFNVTKSVGSSNASNAVVCNSTCKPVSNFISGSQSVKSVRRLIDVNRKRPHERLVNNKNSL